MSMNRRDFLASAAVAPVVAHTAGAAAADAKGYRACVIGDTDHGGYGHSMHVAFAHRDDVEVVALADPNEAGRAKRAAEAGAERTYADYREMLDTEKPDLVVVGPRWTVNHKEYILAAAEAGAHGFLEKPVAVDLAEADAMIEAVEAKNLKWAIAHNFRSLASTRHAKKLLLKDRIIGSILELRGRGKEDNRAGGEDMIVLGTHVFDFMIYLMGNPRWCQSDITTNGKPALPEQVHEATEPLGPIVGNRIHAMYGFKTGIAGYFDTMKSRDGNGGRFGLDIYGTQGIMTVRINVPPAIHVLRESSWAPGAGGAQWEPLPDAPDMTMANPDNERNAGIVDDLMAAIAEDREPEFSLRSGRDAYAMIQAVYEAYVQGGRVAMPLENRDHPLKRWG